MITISQKLEFIKNSIRSVPNYPKPGIIFRDITSLLKTPKAFAYCIEILVAHYQNNKITKVVGIESRGFLFGAPVALGLGVGFIPVRKAGKLPCKTFSESCELEYGSDMLELHQDAITPNDIILIVDDLLATGGTIEAAIKLIHRAGGNVYHAAFIIKLCGYSSRSGTQRLNALGIENYSLIYFPVS
ncbi:MAG: adenine phosphoribosyltransferase [Candidatus Dasytiphilus stammeri]